MYQMRRMRSHALQPGWKNWCWLNRRPAGLLDRFDQPEILDDLVDGKWLGAGSLHTNQPPSGDAWQSNGWVIRRFPQALLSCLPHAAMQAGWQTCTRVRHPFASRR